MVQLDPLSSKVTVGFAGNVDPVAMMKLFPILNVDPDIVSVDPAAFV